MDVMVGRWKQMFLRMYLDGSARRFPWYGYDEVIISIIVSKSFTYHRNINLQSTFEYFPWPEHMQFTTMSLSRARRRQVALSQSQKPTKKMFCHKRRIVGTLELTAKDSWRNINCKVQYIRHPVSFNYNQEPCKFIC